MCWYCGILIFIAQFSMAQSANQLSAAEQKAGWQLLFDGKTTNGWRGAYINSFPKTGWKVVNGELRGELSNGAESGDAGDIVTVDTYQSFELVFDWKLGKGGNSGVKYFIEERQPKPAGSQAGYEYQLIDDADYIYNGKHLPQDLKTGSIYDVIPAEKPDVRVEVWHTSRIIVHKNRIEHWLDGQRVLATDRDSEAFKKGVIDSKFNDYQGFGQIPEGHILLQDHGHSVAFKTIKIRKTK
ncbi:3-keto-disaccharide hydrolase [Spirosoma areae]